MGLLSVVVVGFLPAEILERASTDSRPKANTANEGFSEPAAHEFAPAGAFMLVVVAVVFVGAKPHWHKPIGWRRVSNKAAVGHAKAEWSRDERRSRLRRGEGRSGVFGGACHHQHG